MPQLKTLAINLKYRANGLTDSESQTDIITPTSSAMEIFTKYMQVLQGSSEGAGDGLEIKGFPNISSVQRIMLQQSQQACSIQRKPSDRELVCNFISIIEQSLMMNNSIISLKHFKKPTTLVECNDIIHYWTFYFPLSKLKKFFSSYFIKSNVLLEATQGLMIDSEFLSCDLVDMKWTFFLEGALAQATSICLEKQKVPISKMKNLLQDYNNLRLNSIQQNRAIIANTEKHHLVLENSIYRLSRLFNQISSVLGVKQQKHCQKSNSKFTLATKLPRAPKLPKQKTYLMYFKGLKIRIVPIPGHRNKIYIEGGNHYAVDKNNYTLVMAMEPLLQAGPDELHILHMRDLDTFFDKVPLSIQRK